MGKKLVVGVLASGRGTNLQSIINSIEEGRLDAEIGIVISDNPEAKALLRAENHGLKQQCIESGDFADTEEYEEEMIEVLEENNVDLVAMAGFMKILSSYFIQHYSNRIMNIHPSLLPAFPGTDAQKQALEYGVKVSGCTVHFADEGMDSGPIIMQAAVSVLEDDTVESLSKRILAEEHRIYPEAIQLYADNKLQVRDDRVEIL
ncbi:phosphoribosylglycinamide formyltransferase [Acetohalobium arabaticum]|uniref:Phosphoribosylglycinamide formyltransferase n=1 Tax=Acetohalobium arabaticum (strain ATCC 49924 / DSM 5501 / Z-7288) TaxID=574087 RepID=D9QUJ1_ACEAZ|nr:phosphoribosylglycinamide formyltransferase [Acetohalobium arabaticum]ADL13792.1 formyltetrahydrofolate-dependent phosphoribosylglycinamide formyltransferase [Acetohalobium arabaticum DSM 5501]